MASSVNLGAQLDEAIEELVRSGRYGSRSEVLREGVRLVQEREARLAKIRAGIERGLADMGAGRVKDADEVFDRLERKYEAMTSRKR